MKLIAGLGNPGGKYERSRHNLGFMALDRLAMKRGLVFAENKKFQALVAKDSETLLVKPLTFMNNSGEAVAAVMNYYKLLPRQFGLLRTRDADLCGILTVVHDDLDIELGAWRESIDSRSAGQRGVQSVIDRLKTKNFRRLRIGLKSGDRPSQMSAADYVLGRFSAEEMAIVDRVIDDMIAAGVFDD